MKNLVTIVLLGFCSYAMAQVTFGPKVGLNYTNITDVHGSSDSRLGFHIGGFASIPVIKSSENQFYIQTEVLYSQQGEKNDKELSDVAETFELDYIAIPVLFRAYFSEKETEFFGEIGPQFSFLVSDNINRSDDSPSAYSYEEYSSFDAGLTLGLGFSLYRQYEAIFRYNYGFVDVVENDRKDNNNSTSNVSFGLGYRF